MIPGIVAGAPFAGVPWTPAQLSPVLWLNDDSPVTDAGGGACSQWDDISGASRHFSQGTPSRRPAITAGGLNGRRVITFDGSDDVLDASSTAADITQNAGAFCIFIVANPDIRSTTTVARLLSFGVGLAANSSARAAIYLVSSTIRLAQRRLDADTVSNNSLAHASKAWRIHQTSHLWSSAQSILRIDGGTPQTVATGQGSGNTSNTASTYVEMGGTVTTTGQNSATGIAEVVCLSAIPSSADREKMEGYLAHRWGLTANLPGGHPYKSAPP